MDKFSKLISCYYTNGLDEEIYFGFKLDNNLFITPYKIFYFYL